jgi:hypothetical protein
MKFEFKSVPVPKFAKKFLPKGNTNVAYKVKWEGAVCGVIIGSVGDGGHIWGYCLAGKLYGGYESRQAAAEGLAKA